MALIRAFETRVAELYRDSEIPGFVHTSLGQEAVAAGVGAALERRRLRRHHPPRPRPLPGPRHGRRRDDGRAVRPRRGHLPRQGRLDAHRRPEQGRARRQRDRRRQPAARGRRRRCRASCSARAASRSPSSARARSTRAPSTRRVNLAAIWDLPALLVCENNIYAEFTDSRTMTRVPAVAERAATYGIEAETVDGNDVDRRARAGRCAPRARCREGDGPFLIEAETYRWHGHYEGDAAALQARGRGGDWRERDPLEVSARAPRRARRAPATSELDGDRGRGAGARSRRRSSAPAQLPPPSSRRPSRMSSATEAPARQTRYIDALGEGHGDRARRGRAGRRDRHRRRRGRRHLPRHQGPARALRRRARDRHADQRDGLRRRRGRRGDDRAAADRRDHVHGLRRRLHGPDPQPGGEAPLHDRRGAGDPGRLPHADRRRQVRRAPSTRRASRPGSPTSPGSRW